jgi:hypothetical protein
MAATVKVPHLRAYRGVLRQVFRADLNCSDVRVGSRAPEAIGASRRSPTSRPGIVLGGEPDICCEPTPPIPRTGLVALRGLSARRENRIAMVVAIGGASCTAPVASAYELIQKPTTASMRRGSTAKPPSPDSPPRSLAKTTGPWRKLAEMNALDLIASMSGFGHTKTRKGDLHDRTSPFVGLMPPARVIAGPRALLTSILLVTRVPCRGIGGWRANPRT